MDCGLCATEGYVRDCGSNGKSSGGKNGSPQTIGLRVLYEQACHGVLDSKIYAPPYPSHQKGEGWGEWIYFYLSAYFLNVYILSN